MSDTPKRVILDFDGTCTQVERVQESYLADYGARFGAAIGSLSAAQWQDVLEAVRARSPQAGWTLAGPSAAPAAADPYILAYEAASLILRQRGVTGGPPLFTIHHDAYEAAPAPWRPDAADTLWQLIDKGVHVAFISNSSSTYINGRLDQLFPGEDAVRANVLVHSDAGKFRVVELPPEPSQLLDDDARKLFGQLPAALDMPELGRPVYLRRGSYFEALAKAFGGDFGELDHTVVCGDIWELDLAMPLQLGARIHLLDRAPPFETYDYERRAVAAAGDRGKNGVELASLLDWFV